MNELVIMSQTGKPVTSSLIVAEKFGKEHKHVLDSIRNLTAENSALLPMFAKSTYLTSQNKELPMYIMNRDGFALLVMGFTGSRALDFKVAFIDAFNRMEERCQTFQIDAGMVRSIVREELRGITGAAGTTGATRAISAASTTGATDTLTIFGIPKATPLAFKVCKVLTVKDDAEAKRFYDSLDIAAVAKKTAYANACVLNSIRDRMITDMGKVLRRRGSYRYFMPVGQLLDGVWAAGWRHDLPTNARRLCGRFYNYMEYGYRSLVNVNAGNQQVRKS